MSLTYNQKVTFWEHLLSSIRGKTDWYYDHFHIREQSTATEVIWLWCGVIADSMNLDVVVCKRQILRIVECVVALQLADISAICDFIREFITHYDTQFGFRQGPNRDFHGGINYTAFKQLCRCKLTSTQCELIYQFKPLWIEFLVHADAATFWPLNQIACFPTRLNVERRDLQTKLMEEYVLADRELAFHPTDFLARVRTVVVEWFETFEFHPLNPHHGPGASADITGKVVAAKYRALGGDDELFSFIRSTGTNPWKAYPALPGSFDRLSKLVFVPKSIKTLRAINEEPVTLMYWQQAVKDQLCDWMAAHPALSRIIVLDDSSINGEWARKGSETGAYATLDLKAASDSVSYELVKYLFRGTAFEECIDALRASDVILPNGTIMSARKFAPMGNALCFPIECIVFASICETVIRDATRSPSHHLLKVYGDDIVVHDYFASAIADRLSECGFRINAEKSFSGYDTAFRESCGVEAYLGVNVTPIRISRKYSAISDMHRVHDSVRRPRYEEQIEPLYNRAFSLGYMNVLYCLRGIIDFNYHLFSYPGLPGLDTWFPTNFHLPARRERDGWFVRTVQYVPRIRRRTIRCDEDELIRYHHWFTLPECVSFRDRPRIAEIGNQTQKHFKLSVCQGAWHLLAPVDR